MGGDNQLGRRLLQAVHHRLLPQVRVQGHHRETTLETRLKAKQYCVSEVEKYLS